MGRSVTIVTLQNVIDVCAFTTYYSLICHADCIEASVK